MYKLLYIEKPKGIGLVLKSLNFNGYLAVKRLFEHACLIILVVTYSDSL